MLTRPVCAPSQVVQACEHCRGKRLKCTGGPPPCELCAAKGAECVFASAQVVAVKKRGLPQVCPPPLPRARVAPLVRYVPGVLRGPQGAVQALRDENVYLRRRLSELEARGAPPAPGGPSPKTIVIEPLRPSLSAESRRIWDILSYSRATATFTQSPLSPSVRAPVAPSRSPAPRARSMRLCDVFAGVPSVRDVPEARRARGGADAVRCPT